MKREMISNIKIGKRFRKDMGNLTPLASSIASIGLLHPIVINSDCMLIAGERRLLACKQLKWEEIPVTICNLDNIIQAENDENDEDIRKNFSVSERTAIARALEAQLNGKGERRGNPNLRKDVQSSSDVDNDNNSHKEQKQREIPIVDARPQLGKGEKTRESVAKAAGFESSHSLRNAERLEELGCQDLRDAVDDKVITLYDAASICDDEHDVQAEAVKRVLYGTFKTVKAAVEAIRLEREERSIELSPITDCNGINVPDNLREYFEAASLFNECLQMSEQLRYKLNELDRHPISKYRQRGQLQSYCKTIEASMNLQRFGFVCPSCEGIDGENCNCCQNQRWFNAGSTDKVDLKKFGKGK